MASYPTGSKAHIRSVAVVAGARLESQLIQKKAIGVEYFWVVESGWVMKYAV